MLAHRLRRWANIKPTLFQRIVFAGLSSLSIRGVCQNTILSQSPDTVDLSHSQSLITMYFCTACREKQCDCKMMGKLTNLKVGYTYHVVEIHTVCIIVLAMRITLAFL